jgi:predicted Zn-dependent protease
MAAFEAVYFAPGGGGSRPCRVVLEAGGLRIEPAGGQPVRWPYPGLAAEIGGDEHEWIFLSCLDAGPGVARLALRDPAVIAEIAARTPGPTCDLLTRFEVEHRRHTRRRWRGLAAFALAASITAVAGWMLLTRAAPELVVASVPPATEQLLGQAAMAQLLAGEEEIKGGPAVEAVEAIMDRLTAAVADSPYRFEVHVIRSEVVNAAALPGGGIVVYSGLLAEAGSAEEVAGVLAHEIQHVLHRDSLRQLVSQLGGAAVIAIAFGGGDLAALVRQAGAIDRLAYGREQEAAADRDGLALLAAAGLPPAAMPDFFARLERREAGGLPEFLSTHPDTARRIAELRRLAAATPVTAPRPLDIDWAAVRASLE